MAPSLRLFLLGAGRVAAGRCAQVFCLAVDSGRVGRGAQPCPIFPSATPAASFRTQLAARSPSVSLAAPASLCGPAAWRGVACVGGLSAGVRGGVPWWRRGGGVRGCVGGGLMVCLCVCWGSEWAGVVLDQWLCALARGAFSCEGSDLLSVGRDWFPFFWGGVPRLSSFFSPLLLSLCRFSPPSFCSPHSAASAALALLSSDSPSLFSGSEQEAVLVGFSLVLRRRPPPTRLAPVVFEPLFVAHSPAFAAFPEP